jgi:hypothetical protein
LVTRRRSAAAFKSHCCVSCSWSMSMFVRSDQKRTTVVCRDRSFSDSYDRASLPIGPFVPCLDNPPTTPNERDDLTPVPARGEPTESSPCRGRVDTTGAPDPGTHRPRRRRCLPTGHAHGCCASPNPSPKRFLGFTAIRELRGLMEGTRVGVTPA